MVSRRSSQTKGRQDNPQVSEMEQEILPQETIAEEEQEEGEEEEADIIGCVQADCLLHYRDLLFKSCSISNETRSLYFPNNKT